MGIVTSPISIAYGEPHDGLCPRTDFEWAVSNAGCDAEAELQRWRELLRRAEEGNYAQVFQREAKVNLAQSPEGTSWPRWARWVESRLEELARDPGSVVPVPLDQEWLLRHGEFDATAQDVVRRALGGVGAPAGTGRRDHLVVDAGERVGTHHVLDPDTRHVTEEPTSQVGVVVERGTGGALRVVGFAPADPDARAGLAACREQWPVLTSALGGWFHGSSIGASIPWWQQVTMLEEETDERLHRLTREGADLLRLDDAELRAAVSATGCHVEPSFLRHWLEWMFWRIKTFEWK
jgi:hypothetical protein